MQKIVFLFCALGAMLLGASCNKLAESGSQPVVDFQDDDHINLEISLGGLATKATDASVEKDRAISSIQILVFNAKNETEGYCKATALSSIPTITVSHGNKTVWAVVNYNGDLSQVLSVSDFLGKDIALQENAVGRLVMTGTATKNVTSQDHAVSIAVSHLTSKVSIAKITRDFSIYAQAQKSMTINGIYIINAVGATKFDGTLGTTWVNKLGNNDPAVKPLLADELNTALANGSTYTTLHTFYPYPNNNKTLSTSSEWSTRKSLLVIDTTLGGEKSYYPIWLPKGNDNVLEANKHYEITDIKLTKAGSESPFEPVTAEQVSVSITVTDFTTGNSYTEEI